jgi:hypothetical protein
MLLLVLLLLLQKAIWRVTNNEEALPSLRPPSHQRKERKVRKLSHFYVRPIKVFNDLNNP